MKLHVYIIIQMKNYSTLDCEGISMATHLSHNYEGIISQAAADIGIPYVSPTQAEVEHIHFSDESLPFIRRQLKGNSGLRILFHNILIAPHHSQPQLRNHFTTTLAAYVLPETCYTIKVVSFWPRNCGRIADQPGCAEEERQIGPSESYGLSPSSSPSIPLLKAMESITEWTEQVKQFQAIRVLHSCDSHLERDVWIIYLRGTPVGHTKSRVDPENKLPDDAFNHLRSVVDSATAEWIWTDRIPQPPGLLEQRY